MWVSTWRPVRIRSARLDEVTSGAELGVVPEQAMSGFVDKDLINLFFEAMACLLLCVR